MRYLLQCSSCKATVWVSGEDDPDTNSLTLGDPGEWDDGDPNWPHDDFEVIDEEYPEPLEDDVI